MTAEHRRRPCPSSDGFIINSMPSDALPGALTDGGSAMIAIIAAIVLFSVLAAALVPMIGSSEQQITATNLSANARQLATSGFRYMLGRYRAEGIDALEDYNDNTFTLTNNDGRFNIKATSYFYVIMESINEGSLTFTANPPGFFPRDEISIDNNSYLIIEDKPFRITGSSVSTDDETADVSFTVNQWDDVITEDARVYPMAYVDTGQTPTLNDGGDLAYQSGQGQMFPPINGRVRVGLRVLTYSYKSNTESKFVDIHDPNDPSMADVPVTDETRIILTNDTKIQSTGISGSGGIETRRTSTFYNALPLDEASIPTYTLDEDFADDSGDPDSFKPADGDAASMEIAQVDGNNALTVTSSGTSMSAQLDLAATGTEAPLINYRSLSGGYLSYDAQVKVGFYGLGTDWTAPIPIDVAAGLTFRLGDIPTGDTDDLDINIAFSGYGLSFVRGSEATLPTDIVPPGMDGKPMIVLWQQTLADDGSINRNWMAYKQLRARTVLFEEDFSDGETVIGSTDNQWKKVPDDANNQWWITNIISNSPPYACYFQPIIFDIPNTRESGGIQTPPIDINSCEAEDIISISFSSFDGTDGSPVRQVNVKDLDDNTLSTFDIEHDPDGNWKTEGPFYLKNPEKSIRVEFYFDEGPPNRDYSGWFFDDVSITCMPSIQDSTLLVRLQEAAVIKYRGGDAETFSRGDRVYGQDSAAFGTVIAPPYWDASDGDGSGIILLNNLSSVFSPTIGENIMLLGKGDSGADIEAYDGTTDLQANIIKAYYALATGSDTGDDDPLNGNMRPYPRRTGDSELRWPPAEDEEWTAAVDYFQLLEWDGINSDISNLSAIPFTIENENDNLTVVSSAILSSYDPKLQTTSSDPELGLHAFGPSINKIYFDDFGLRLILPPSPLFSPPLVQ